MDAIEAIRGTINHSHEWFEGTMSDLTQEQADYLPPGTAHPIGALVAHILQSEDTVINGMVQGQPSVWESGGWEQKLGIPNVARLSQEVARSFKGDLNALRPYKEAVFASTQSCLDGLSVEDLDREVEIGEGTMTVFDALTNVVVGNNLAHTGEISALKGVQGAKGYAF